MRLSCLAASIQDKQQLEGDRRLQSHRRVGWLTLSAQLGIVCLGHVLRAAAQLPTLIWVDTKGHVLTNCSLRVRAGHHVRVCCCHCLFRDRKKMEMTTPVFSTPRTTSGTNSSGASMQFVIEKKMGGEQWPHLALPAVVCF